MEVRVREFRDCCDHLFRLVNADYHSCVGQRELGFWVERVERVIEDVEQMTCKRAKEGDLEQYRGCLEAAKKQLLQARDRLGLSVTNHDMMEE